MHNPVLNEKSSIFHLTLPCQVPTNGKTGCYQLSSIVSVALAGIALVVIGVLGYLNIISSLNSITTYSTLMGVGGFLDLCVLIQLVRVCGQKTKSAIDRTKSGEKVLTPPKTVFIEHRVHFQTPFLNRGRTVEFRIHTPAPIKRSKTPHPIKKSVIQTPKHLSSPALPSGPKKPPTPIENEPTPTTLKKIVEDPKEIVNLKKVFEIAKSLPFSFSLKENKILNANVPESDVRRAIEDRSIYLKHAKLLLYRVLDKYPQLNNEAYLPGLCMIALTLSLKYNEDLAVWNNDVRELFPALSHSGFNKMEREFLGMLKWNLTVASVEEMEDELEKFSKRIILPEQYPVEIKS